MPSSTRRPYSFFPRTQRDVPGGAVRLEHLDALPARRHLPQHPRLHLDRDRPLLRRSPLPVRDAAGRVRRFAAREAATGRSRPGCLQRSCRRERDAQGRRVDVRRRRSRRDCAPALVTSRYSATASELPLARHPAEATKRDERARGHPRPRRRRAPPGRRRTTRLRGRRRTRCRGSTSAEERLRSPAGTPGTCSWGRTSPRGTPSAGSRRSRPPRRLRPSG